LLKTELDRVLPSKKAGTTDGRDHSSTHKKPYTAERHWDKEVTKRSKQAGGCKGAVVVSKQEVPQIARLLLAKRDSTMTSANEERKVKGPAGEFREKGTRGGPEWAH